MYVQYRFLYLTGTDQAETYSAYLQDNIRLVECRTRQQIG
jgi:hypothetical protein